MIKIINVLVFIVLGNEFSQFSKVYENIFIYWDVQ